MPELTLFNKHISSEQVRQIVRNNPNILNKRNEHTRITPILYFVNRDRWDLVELLATEFPNKNRLNDTRGYGTALLQAIAVKQFEIAKKLVKANASLDYYDSLDQMDIVLFAIYNRANADFLNFLLDNGADYCFKNKAGESPILLAAKLNLWDLVLVIARKGNVDCTEIELIKIAKAQNQYKNIRPLINFEPLYQVDEFGYTPLVAAVHNRRNDDIIAYLNFLEDKSYELDANKAGLCEDYDFEISKAPEQQEAKLITQGEQQIVKNSSQTLGEFFRIYKALYNAQSSLFKNL